MSTATTIIDVDRHRRYTTPATVSPFRPKRHQHLPDYHLSNHLPRSRRDTGNPFPFFPIGFNDGVPITEHFYAEYISVKHNEDMAKFFFPDDHQRGLKFTDEKEAMFRR
ncbi:hypothetical protein U1Q18_032607 [Sarracenia purpurea var. burkii]